MGPTSLLAVKRGEVDFPYDGRFLFAEVNADKIYWVVGNDGSLKLERIEKHRWVGSCTETTSACTTPEIKIIQ